MYRNPETVAYFVTVRCLIEYALQIYGCVETEIEEMFGFKEPKRWAHYKMSEPQRLFFLLWDEYTKVTQECLQTVYENCFDELSKIIEDDERCTCSIAYISEDTSFFNSHAVVISKYSVRCLSLADAIETLIMMDDENKCSNKNSTCYGCIYFNACGDEERTEPCDGKCFNKENKS
jgi:hypothetical protein